MPSFRKVEEHVARSVARVTALGKKKTEAAGKIRGLRTRDNIQSQLTVIGKVLRQHLGVSKISKATPEQLTAAVQHQAKYVKTEHLDNYRQAIRTVLGIKVGKIVSEIATERGGRAYTRAQVEAIIRTVDDRYKLSTEIAWRCGLRSIELFTLRPAGERQMSERRAWREDRFIGRNVDGVRYTVIGKGNLVREVMVPRDLHERLEKLRRPEPITVTNRGIFYESHYDLPGGKQWADAFSAAARDALGWSHGAHGLRHSYAQGRMVQVMATGKTYGDALRIVSQELGHFRPSVTLTYLRSGRNAH